MRVVYSLPDAQLHQDSVVTIGAFDGVHLGHRAVIDSVRQAALACGCASAVVTFFPHPSVVLGRAEPFYLTSTEEKIAALETLGIDWVVVMNFTVEMSHTRAADYVSMLIDHLHMREVHVGYDFTFGYKREGTVAFLERMGAERGFRVHPIQALTNGDEPISSTGIRRALREGNVELAAHWLGRPFRLSGTVTRGEGSAVQLDVWPEHAIPADGVYTCRAEAGGAKTAALVTIGTQVMAEKKSIRSVAAQLREMERHREGERVSLEFLARLRGATGKPA
ncbi:MAG TPA: riboflavin kinase [Anaerolineae bacterium]